MFTHWSPIRSACLITCSSAATTRRSLATGACSASSDRIPWWTSRIAAVDPVVVLHDDRRQLDVLVLERLERAVERVHDQVERAERLHLEPAQLVLEMDPRVLGHQVTRPYR